MRNLTVFGIIILIGLGVLGFLYWSSQQGTPPDMLEMEYLEANDRFVDVSGARIRVREQGPKDAPPLLLLHGFTYSLESWDAWADQLSDEFRIIRYDLLGHGLTGPDPKERYAPAERAAFLGEVMEALELESAIIAGNSLGGLASWRFAASPSSRASALILVSPGAYPINGVSEQPAPIPEPVKFFLRTAPEVGVRASVSQLYGRASSVSDERIREIGDMMRREGNGDAMIRSLEEFTLPDPEVDLARIEVPVLLLWGESDRLIPMEHGERLLEVLPDARMITYQDVGHVAHEEVPVQSAQDAAAFIREIVLEK